MPLKRLYILHIITRLDRGGSAINTLLCAYEQAKLGHHVQLVYGSSLESKMSDTEKACVEAEKQRFLNAGGKLTELSTLMRAIGWHDVLAYRAIRKIISQGTWSIVHSHTSKAGSLTRLAAWGHAQKLIHTPHGHVFDHYFSASKSYLFALIERFLAHRCHALVALTKAERDAHLERGIGRAQQWHIIPSGVNVQSIQQALASQSHQKQWYAISIGRLEKVKGMDRLLPAWQRLLKHKPQAKLAIIGDGAERQALMQQCQDLSIDASVHFAGWCDPLNYLLSAERFVLLSRNEGMGRVVVEAMAAGLPCIVSNVGGLPELVDSDVGFVVDAEQSHSIAQALLANIEKNMSIEAQIRAQAYSQEKMIALLEQLYQEPLS